MGVYDTVWVKCPNCKTENGFQSKSGDCILAEYDLEDCPENVLMNVNRHSPMKCGQCGELYEVDLKSKQPVLTKDDTNS